MTPFAKGTLIASAVAGLFGCATSKPAPMPAGATASSTVHCRGVNSCKGQGSCAGADNSCKGLNSCKGKGWVEMASGDECTGKGGAIEHSKVM